MKKLLEIIKNFFYEDIVEEEEEKTTNINYDLIKEIKRIMEYEGLTELIENNVVRIYLLEMYSAAFIDLFNISEFSNSRHSVSVGDYFEKNGGRIYSHLNVLISYIEKEKLSYKAEQDIIEIIRMFDFYLGE